MVAKPYIGITGAASREEVESIIQEFNMAGYTMNTPHIPMLGFLVKDKNLNELNTPVGNRYPRFNDIRDLLEQAKGRVLTMIHYCPSKDPLVRLPLPLAIDQIFKKVQMFYDDGLCMSVQLNISWPDDVEVKSIKDNYRDMQIVFQLRKQMIQDESRKVIVEKLKKYDSCLSYVLIDPSAGKGREFDIDESTALYHEIKQQLPDLTVGFAGGLAGQNCVEKLGKIIMALQSSDFCIDSESGVRDKQADTLKIEKVKKHLQEVALVLK